jgi:threonine/homoserine/homoserine lactone efflux protein
VPPIDALALFVAASLALLLVPGPSVIYIVSRSLGEGRRAGLISALGVEAGALVHVGAATVGLSALLASSADAFAAVRYAGAAYLVALGVRRLLSASAKTAGEARPASTRAVFWQGVVVNVLNPKTALFFAAFLPQFADPTRGSVAVQVALLGVLFVALALLSDGTYALLAGNARRRLVRGGASQRRLARLSGGTYVGLGAVVALSGTRPVPRA